LTNEHENILTDLETKIWKTKGARFNAARRLQSRKTWGSYLVSAYSIYILSISIFLLTQTSSNNALNLSSIFGSLLILVFSLHEGSLNAEQKAERHHICAKDLTALYDKVILRIKQSNESDAETLIRQYAEIIDRCPENHDTIDYELFQTEHEKFKKSWIKKQLIKLEYGIFKKTCLLIIVAPPIALAVSQVI
jgi:hypothetical protein